MEIKSITTNQAPAPVGAYSQAIQVGPWIFLSGQIPLNPQTQKIVVGDISIQTKQVMQNIQAILQSAGANFSNIVKATIFLKDIKHFSQVDAEYSRYLKAPFPVRSCMAVRDLPKGAEVEIEVTAYINL